MRSRDLAISVLLALALVIIYVCCRWCLRPEDVTGYWRSTMGAAYRIRLGPAGQVVVAGGARQRGDGRGRIGKIAFFRRVCIGGKCGSVDFGRRHIDWGKERWVREGLV